MRHRDAFATVTLACSKVNADLETHIKIQDALKILAELIPSDVDQKTEDESTASKLVADSVG